MTEILSRDEVILRQVGDLDEAASIELTDTLLVAQGGALKRTTASNIFDSANAAALDAVDALETQVYTDLADYINNTSNQDVGGVKTFTDGPRITKPAGTASELRFASGTSDRWAIEKNSVAESGSNAGSNFVISSINDDGTTKTAAVTITRSNRAIALSGTLSVAQAVTLSTTLAVAGNTTIGGTLGVAGASTLASAAVTGNATVGGTLGVTSNATVGGTLAVTGTSSFTGQVTVPTPSGNANAARKENVDLVQTNLDTHVANAANPHSVTPAQVGNTTAQWNADKLQGTNVQNATPTDGQALIYSGANARWQPTSQVGITSGVQSFDGVKTFTSSPIVPTLAVGDSTTKVATSAFVQQEINAKPGYRRLGTITGDGSSSSFNLDLSGVAGTIRQDKLFFDYSYSGNIGFSCFVIFSGVAPFISNRRTFSSGSSNVISVASQTTGFWDTRYWVAFTNTATKTAFTGKSTAQIISQRVLFESSFQSVSPGTEHSYCTVFSFGDSASYTTMKTLLTFSAQGPTAGSIVAFPIGFTLDVYAFIDP